MADRKLTNMDVFVKAMDEAADEDGTFVEWEVTVKAWKIDRNRYGLRGYENEYPDHKKVANNYMDKKSGAIGKGFMEKVAKNTYRITRLGQRRAAHLRSLSGGTHGMPDAISQANKAFDTRTFDRLHRALETPAVRHYAENNREIHPLWNFSASLLGVSADDARASVGSIRVIVSDVVSALEALNHNEEWGGMLKRSPAEEGFISEISLCLLLSCIGASVSHWRDDLELIEISTDRILSEIQDNINRYNEAKGYVVIEPVE